MFHNLTFDNISGMRLVKHYWLHPFSFEYHAGTGSLSLIAWHIAQSPKPKAISRRFIPSHEKSFGRAEKRAISFSFVPINLGYLRKSNCFLVAKQIS